MKYDPEYDSYKFTREEISMIIFGLISYSADPFLDKITHKNVLNLLENINKSTNSCAAQDQ